MRAQSLFLTFFIVSIAAFTQAPEPKHDPNLQILDWLTRGTWTASPKGPDGRVTLIESKIRWAKTGTAIHFETTFNGKPQYYGLYTYDPERKQIRFFYASVDGQFSEGRVAGNANGFEMSFTVSDTNGTARYQGTIAREGNDAYDFNVYGAMGKTPVVTVRYERKDDNQPVFSENSIREFLFLEGRWEGHGDFPGIGPVRDTYVFKRIMNDNFLGVDYVVKDAKDVVVWQDHWILFRDPESKQIKTVNFGQDGSIASSVVISSSEKTWCFDGITKGSPQFREYSFELKKLTPTTMEFRTLVRQKQGLELLYQGRYDKQGGE
jgi:hypothetical protein